MNAEDGRPLSTIARATFVWVVAFIGLHVPWYLAGLPTPIPETTADYLFTAVVLAMVVAGTALPLAMVQSWGRGIPRAILAVGAGCGGVLLLLRGGLGVVDLALRESGIAELGLTGLSDREINGGVDPGTFKIWLGAGVDLGFLLGGVLFTALALRFRRVRHGRGADVR